MIRFDDDSYLRAYDHNYRVAYEEGAAYLGQGASQKRALRRIARLLHKTGLPARGTKLLDVGCGDGTNGIFLADLGYHYTGIDISEAAVERARQRGAEARLDVEFRVENVLDLSEFQAGRFAVVLDSYCLHMLVLDPHRAAYFENVKRVLRADGLLVLLAQRDEKAYEGPVTTFEGFLRQSGVDPAHPGVPFQKCVEGEWVEVPGKEVVLLGRPKSLKGYKQELAEAGFGIQYQSVFGRDRSRVAFVLKKK